MLPRCADSTHFYVLCLETDPHIEMSGHSIGLNRHSLGGACAKATSIQPPLRDRPGASDLS